MKLYKTEEKKTTVIFIFAQTDAAKFTEQSTSSCAKSWRLILVADWLHRKTG
jgi:hypothetical protein